jgi:hypothetical protein
MGVSIARTSSQIAKEYYFSPSFTSVGGCIKKSSHEKKLDSTSL